MILLGTMFVVMAIASGVVFFICRNARKRLDLTDDEVRQFRDYIETQAKARAELFGDNIYDVHRSR